MKLEGKVAIITGGSKGIGLGCAKIFAKYGCKVVIAARGEEEGEKVAGELRDAGGLYAELWEALVRGETGAESGAGIGPDGP